MSARGKPPSMNGLVIFRYLKEASRPECFPSIFLAFHQENGCAQQTTIWLFDLQETKAPRTSGRRHSGAQKRKDLQDRESEGGLGGMRCWGCCWPEIGFSAMASSPVAHDLQAEDLREFSDVCLFHYTLGWSEWDLKAWVIHHLPRFGFSIANWKRVVLTVPGDFQCLLLKASMVLVALDNTLSLILSTIHRMRPPTSREGFTGSQS